MFILDFDIIGTIIFLWFIFKGLRESQEAKKKHAQRQKKQRSSTTTRRTSQPKDWELEPVKPVSPQERKRPKLPVFPTFEPEPVPPVMTTFPENLEKDKKLTQKPVTEIKEQVVKKESSPIYVETLSPQESKITLPFENQAVVNGIIWSEILGPPRAKKKHKAGIQSRIH